MSTKSEQSAYNLRKRKREKNKKLQNLFQNKRTKTTDYLSEDLSSTDEESYIELADLSLSDEESSDKELSDCESSSEERSSSDDKSDDIETAEDRKFIDDSDLNKNSFPRDTSLDTTSLINIIKSKITKHLPDISEEELNKSINEVIQKENMNLHFVEMNATKSQNTIEESLENLYKLETERKYNLKRKDLEPLLEEIQKSLEDEKVDLSKILGTNISFSDKKRAVELYYILENTEEPSLEYKKVELMINNIIKNSYESETEKQEASDIEKELISKTENYIHSLKRKILFLNADVNTKTRIYEMYNSMMGMCPSSDEYSVLKSKIIWAVNLPYRNIVLPEVQFKESTMQEIASFCSKVYERMDSKIYGMKEIKEIIIQILNNRIKNPATQSMLALKGNPGVGKTRVAQVLAESIGLPFEKISLGGMEDPGIFTGQDNSWVGASPSILLKILRRMKCSNGIVLFDELDKLSSSEKGVAIQNTLLHITDYIQNKDFQDSYLVEFPHDLSQIWFMFAMNDDSCLSSALRDRLNIIELKDYTFNETKAIVQKFILPEVLKDVGIDKEFITMSLDACGYLLNFLQSKGLRQARKAVHDIVSKISMFHTLQKGDKELNLSFKVPGFTDFPYTITKETIDSLCPKRESDNLHMYS